MLSFHKKLEILCGKHGYHHLHSEHNDSYNIVSLVNMILESLPQTVAMAKNAD